MQELGALSETAPERVADVAQAISGVVRLLSPLALRHGVELDLATVEPQMTSAVHPSALRQILVSVIDCLIGRMSEGRIELSAISGTAGVEVMLTPTPPTFEKTPGDHVWHELLTVTGGSFVERREGKNVVWQLTLPAVRKARVLVIDDNADLVHFCKYS